MNAQTSLKQAYISKFQNAKEYMLAVMEAMPSEHYGFKPNSEQRSFLEQATHSSQNIKWLSEKYIGLPGFPEQEAANKAEAIDLTEKCFDHFLKELADYDWTDLDTEVEFFAGKKTKATVLLLLIDHLAHHRGQMVAYLRQKEIAPPRYVGW